MANYFNRCLRQWLNGLKHLTKDFLILGLVVITVFLEFKVGWLTPGHGWETVVVNFFTPVVLILIYMSWDLVKAAYELDKKRADEIDILANKLALVTEQWPQRIEKIKQLSCYDREA